MNRLAKFAAVAVLLTGCSAAAAVAPVSSPTPQIIYVTPAPIIAAPAVVLTTPWHTFQNHAVTVAFAFKGELETFVADTSNWDPVSVSVDGMTIEQMARDELTWLDANQPDACYETVYRNWHDEMTNYEAAGRDVSAGADQVSAPLLTQAASELAAGNAALGRATAASALVTCP